jgi:predicted transcriptional regulator
MNDAKRERQDALTLELLQAVDTKSDLTQRHLASQLGVALGLANSYLRRCVRKGLVKIGQAPANRYLYYLTPKGFREKSRLTAEYLHASLNYYHRAGESIADCFNTCVEVGYRRILFAGMSELSEIASVRAHNFDLEIVGTLDHGASVTEFLGRPVWRDIEQVIPFDAVVFTALAEPLVLFRHLEKALAPERIIVPEIVANVLDPVRRG